MVAQVVVERSGEGQVERTSFRRRFSHMHTSNALHPSDHLDHVSFLASLALQLPELRQEVIGSDAHALPIGLIGVIRHNDQLLPKDFGSNKCEVGVTKKRERQRSGGVLRNSCN